VIKGNEAIEHSATMPRAFELLENKKNTYFLVIWVT
jgi:hypothetical protein